MFVAFSFLCASGETTRIWIVALLMNFTPFSNVLKKVTSS